MNLCTTNTFHFLEILVLQTLYIIWPVVMHYSNVTWMSQHLKSLGNWMFVQELVLALCEGNPLVINGLPSQRASNMESFPCHDTMIAYSQLLTKIWWRLNFALTLHIWRHNERNGISHQLHLHCLLKCWFRHRSKETSKLHVTGLCVGNSPVTGGFPAQRASKVENASVRWRHHAQMTPQAPFTSID